MKRILIILFFLFLAVPAFADLSDKLGRFIGYTIIGSKTIVGWYDNKGKKGDSFEGCDFDRVIVFDDNTSLTCEEYGYMYAYRPTAIILAKGPILEMIVEDEVYDMTLR